MKVLWVEDHQIACELLTKAGAAATAKRLPIDLVVASSLLEAESRLRLERFDLVMLDLKLPDSIDEDTTITRIANMGEFRLGVVSASDRRQSMVDFLVKAGRNCSPQAIAKENLAIREFIDHPDQFHDFLQAVMADGEKDAA